MKLTLFIIMTIIQLLAYSQPVKANEDLRSDHALDEGMVDNNFLAGLRSFSGQAITLDNNKITHLVFIDVWQAYSGQGDDKIVAALPAMFLKQSQQIWIQPEINVTKAQLTEFQQALTHITPLVLDTRFSLMRSLNIWSSPFHVLIQGNKRLFSGDAAALTTFVKNRFGSPEKQSKEAPLPEQTSTTLSAEKAPKNGRGKNIIAEKPHKPLMGEYAPIFSVKSLKGEQVTLTSALKELSDKQPLNLVFLDALCPMPQFPECEQKIARLNKLIKEDKSKQWLAVINSYYVNEDYVKGFIDKFALTMPILFDHNNTIYRAYDVYASPYLIKVNQQGIIESRSSEFN
jgi:peroxiredoxin